MGMAEVYRWWCRICNDFAEPCLLGQSGELAYHQFGQPPFVARHALVATGRWHKVAAASTVLTELAPQARVSATADRHPTDHE